MFDECLRILEESMHIKFDEFEELEIQERIIEEDEEESQINSNKENSPQQPSKEEAPQNPPRSWRIIDRHPQDERRETNTKQS